MAVFEYGGEPPRPVLMEHAKQQVVKRRGNVRAGRNLSAAHRLPAHGFIERAAQRAKVDPGLRIVHLVPGAEARLQKEKRP